MDNQGPYYRNSSKNRIITSLLLLLLLSHFSRVWLCVTPIDGSPLGSPVPGILQARTLEWVAIAFSNAWKWKVKVKSLSRVWLFATPWNSPGQNTGVGSLFLLQGIFPTQGANPGLLHLQVDSLPAEPQGKPKNTGVGSLSLLQQMLLTQESNRGHLHCRRTLYHISLPLT